MKLFTCLFLPLLCAAADFHVYIGDSNSYRSAAMTADAAGNSYVTGGRVFGNLLDVFVTKVDASGNILFTTTTGGKGTDTATSIAVDANGNIWIGGYTTSPDFPLRNPLQSQLGLAGSTGFVMKLNADGEIVFSSYFGGTRGPSSVSAVAADSSGNAYLTGTTMAQDFATTPGMPAGNVIWAGVPNSAGAFISKISAAGQLSYSGVVTGSSVVCQGGSSCFLAGRSTTGIAIAVDAAQSAYVAGNTNTTDLPATSGAFKTSGLGAFVMKVNATGSGLAYLSYLGNILDNPLPLPSSGWTAASAIAVDGAGNAYVTGATGDPAFPATAHVYQTALAGPLPPNLFTEPPADAFAAKFSPDGSALVWATYLGGSGVDAAKSIALDSRGNVWLAGTTQSADFPNASGWSSGGDFLAALNSSGSALTYSAREPNNMVSTAIAVDGAGSIHAAGLDGLLSSIASSAQPSLEIYGISNAAIGDLTGRLAPGEVISIYGPHIGPAAPATFSIVNGFAPTKLGGVQVTIGGYAAPLLYVSDWQINAVVPAEITGANASVQITFNDQQSQPFETVTSPGEPGIFGTLTGVAIFNSDGTSNSQANPAPTGSVVSMWATGLDIGASIAADGEIATAAQLFGTSAQVLVGGQPAEILYAGAAPGIVAGVVQINFLAPPEVNANGVAIAIGTHPSPIVPFFEN